MPSRRAEEGRTSRPQSESGEPIVARIVGRCDARLWGLTQAERWRRWLGRAGIADLREASAPLPDSGSVVLARADWVLEESLARPLAAARNVVLVADRPGTAPGAGGGEQLAVAAHVPVSLAAEACELLARPLAPADRDGRLAGTAFLGPTELGSSYHHSLRKRAAPYALSLTDQPLREIERRMFAGAYKGVTDIVTKWVWPVPARWATRWAAQHGVSANSVTTASLVCVLAATWLFSSGHYLGGIAAAWLMAFLDTVDGKLARVTLTSSRWGDVFDHGIDLVHPPFWYWAWWHGLASAGLGAALWIIVGGYVLGRLMEGFFVWQFKIESHAWRPVDSAFRLVTARRNANMLILTAGALCGRPDLGFLAVGVWTILSLAFHAVRIGQALRDRQRGRSPSSWLAEPLRAR